MIDKTDVWCTPSRWREGVLASTRRLIEFADITSTDSVLDVGCGVGGVARQIACERGAHVVGIANSPEQIASAIILNRSFAYTPKPTFLFGDAEHLPFAAASFNCIVCMNMAYHVRAKHLSKELARVTVPGGRLAFDDWYITDRTTAAEVKRLRNDWSSPKGFHTREAYEEAFASAGWKIRVTCELSHIMRHYTDPNFAKAIRTHLLDTATMLYNGWGASALERLITDFTFLGALSEAGKLGYVQFVATKV